MDTAITTINSRLCEVFNVPCKIISDHQVDFELSGWPFDSFTRTGKLGLWSVFRVFEVGRVLTTNHLSHVFSHTFESEDGGMCVGVVSAQTGQFSRNMYRKAAVNSAMRGRISITHIGNTSLTIGITLHESATGEVLGAVERLIVFKNLSLQKAVAVPPALNRLRDKIIESSTKFKVETTTKEEATRPTYKYNDRVRASDMDLIYHVNQAVFFKFCMNAAHEAGKNQFLKNFPLDICEYDTSYAQCKYTGECFAGDWISVFVWEDDVNKQQLHFVIKKEEFTVFFANITFHNAHEARL